MPNPDPKPSRPASPSPAETASPIIGEEILDEREGFVAAVETRPSPYKVVQFSDGTRIHFEDGSVRGLSASYVKGTPVRVRLRMLDGSPAWFADNPTIDAAEHIASPS